MAILRKETVTDAQLAELAAKLNAANAEIVELRRENDTLRRENEENDDLISRLSEENFWMDDRAQRLSNYMLAVESKLALLSGNGELAETAQRKLIAAVDPEGWIKVKVAKEILNVKDIDLYNHFWAEDNRGVFDGMEHGEQLLPFVERYAGLFSVEDYELVGDWYEEEVYSEEPEDNAEYAKYQAQLEAKYMEVLIKECTVKNTPDLIKLISVMDQDLEFFKTPEGEYLEFGRDMSKPGLYGVTVYALDLSPDCPGDGFYEYVEGLKSSADVYEYFPTAEPISIGAFLTMSDYLRDLHDQQLDKELASSSVNLIDAALDAFAEREPQAKENETKGHEDR